VAAPDRIRQLLWIPPVQPNETPRYVASASAGFFVRHDHEAYPSFPELVILPMELRSALNVASPMFLAAIRLRSGKIVIGAVGVSGGKPYQDQAVAMAGAEAFVLEKAE
jgi:hypothetical protein